MAALIIAIFPQNSSRGNWEEQQDRTDPNSRFELARKPAWLLAFRQFGLPKWKHDFECAALRPLRYVSNYTGASTRNTCTIIPDFSLFVIYYFCFYSVFLFRNAFSLRHLLRHFLRNFPDQEDITFHLDCIHPHFRRADRNRRPDISRFIINRCADSDCF